MVRWYIDLVRHIEDHIPELERAAAAGDEVAKRRLAVARFIARHHETELEVVEREVAEHRGKSMEEIGHSISALCRLAASILEGRAAMGIRDPQQEPPHASYGPIVRRLMAVRARRGSIT